MTKPKIEKVKYGEHIPGTIDSHWGAILDSYSGRVLFVGAGNEYEMGSHKLRPFRNVKEAFKAVSNIMSGKTSSTYPILFPGLIGWETITYDKRIVDMVNSGQFSKAIVIENAPDSEVDLMSFAKKILQS